MCIDARKPVFGFCGQLSPKTACPATETSKNIETCHETGLDFVTFWEKNNKGTDQTAGYAVWSAPLVWSAPHQNQMWASTLENLYSGFANNKGADKPAQPHSLVRASDIRLLESIISKLATRKV